MFASDVVFEIGHAFDNYEESEGNDFDLSPDGDHGTITVTAPDGSESKFRITVREI